MIAASLVRGERIRLILVFVFCGNVLIATSYLFDGSGLNGAASCYLGAVQTIVSYLFRSKGRPLPKWLIAVYALSFVVLNLVVAGEITPLVILAIVAPLTFVMSIVQPTGAKYRFWTILNVLLWIVYDILAPVYPALITNGVVLAFTVVGMILHDRKSHRGTGKETEAS